MFGSRGAEALALARRAGSLNRHFRRMVGKDEAVPAPVDLNSLLTDLLALLHAEFLQRGVSLEQLVLNLVRNACEFTQRLRSFRFTADE